LSPACLQAITPHDLENTNERSQEPRI
jgi:hypothetical protein